MNQLFSIHRRLCQVFQSTKPFGGKSVIVVGDFYQLRPVGDVFAFMPRKTSDDLPSLAGNYLWEMFVIFELTEIMRQKDDLKFAEALGRLALGSLTEDDVKMFQSRSYPNDESLPSEVKGAIHLFKSNDEVDEYNLKRMRELADPENVPVISESFDKALGNHTNSDVAKAFYTLPNMKTRQTYGLPRTVIIQRDIRYMITTNIDVADGLFNGASGVLKFVEVFQGKVRAVWFKFDDPSVGATARSNLKGVSDSHNLDNDLTPIVKVKRTFSVLKKGKVQISREQFPFVVAEGWTIHKAQGQSLVTVVVVLSSIMEISLLYVAFSRATSLNGLYIIGKFKPPRQRLPTDPVIVEMNRMKKFCPLIPKFQWLRNVPENLFQIVSHNVQSIRKHHRSIRSDSIYMSSHLLLFQEIWALSSEHYEFPNFSEVVRNDLNGRPQANGTIIYARNNETIGLRNCFSVKSEDEHVEMTYCVKDNLKIINIYKHPKTTTAFLLKSLRHNSTLFNGANILVCGDFNHNMVTDAGLENAFETEYNMKLLSPKQPTTNDMTTIDAVFGRLNDYIVSVSVYESLFSFHKPLVIRILKK